MVEYGMVESWKIRQDGSFYKICKIGAMYKPNVYQQVPIYAMYRCLNIISPHPCPCEKTASSLTQPNSTTSGSPVSSCCNTGSTDDPYHISRQNSSELIELYIK